MVVIGRRDLSSVLCFGFSYLSQLRFSSFASSFQFVLLWSQGREMSQTHGLISGGSNKAKAVLKPSLRITVPRFDNTELIKGYSKTLIGRCMNPQAQDMNTLLYMLPRIWKMEGRIAGADLGMGRFQFDFDLEEDITEVLKMEPYHFDYWMLSLVRWQPVIAANYPSAITFWVRMMGIPLHFWAEPTFRSIGEALGEVISVDIDGGRVQICLDGFQPLVFETAVEFHSGEETTVILRYERLFGFCKVCQSLCHDAASCPVSKDKRDQQEVTRRGEAKTTSGHTSYKGVVLHGPRETYGERSRHPINHREDSKGKGKMVESYDDQRQKYGAGGGKGEYGFSREMRKRVGGTSRGVQRGVEDQYEEAFRGLDKRLEGLNGNGDMAPQSPREQSTKKVRKELSFDAVVLGLDVSGDKVEEFANGQVLQGEKMVPEVEARVDNEGWWKEVLDEEAGGGIKADVADGGSESEVKAMTVEDVGQSLRLEGEAIMETRDVMKAGGVKMDSKVKQGIDRKPAAKRRLFRPTAGFSASGSLRRFGHVAKTPKKKTVPREATLLGEKEIMKTDNNGDLPEGSVTTTTIE